MNYDGGASEFEVNNPDFGYLIESDPFGEEGITCPPTVSPLICA